MPARFLKLLCLISCSCLWAAGCSKKHNTTSKVAQLHLSFNQELTIGGTQNATVKYLFDNPTEIRTGSKGNIYVADAGIPAIRVFDSSGHFLRTIGRAGKGPGEFTSLSIFMINDQNELVAFDASNKRITTFSDHGQVLSTHIASYQTMVWPSQVLQLKNGDYIFLDKLRDIPGLKNESQRLLHSTLLHLYDHSFHYLSSFGYMDSLITKASAKVIRLYISTWNPGYVCPASGGGIWYAPGIYNGHIFKFQKGQHGWVLAKTIKGHLMTPAVTLHDKSDGAFKVVTYGKTRSHIYSARINSEELGLFTLKDGRLINFSSQLYKGVRMTMVEVFTPKGELEGFGRIKKLTFPGSTRGALITSLWMDDNDRFYFIDKRKAPVIRIGTIEGL